VTNSGVTRIGWVQNSAWIRLQLRAVRSQLLLVGAIHEPRRDPDGKNWAAGCETSGPMFCWRGGAPAFLGKL